MQDKLALAGTRSGIAAASALNVLKSLRMNEDLTVFERVLQYNMDLADYFVERLKEYYPQEKIERKYFNITFPRGHIPDAVINEHLLMRRTGDRLQAIMLMNVNKDLIDDFFEKVRAC